MSSPSQWQDRRGMFQRGKEVHTPSNPDSRRFHETGAVTESVRRASSAGSDGSGIDKAMSGTSTGSSSSGSYPTAGRRRSSAASNGSLFNKLSNMKRGSEDYDARRASQNDMQQGQGGIVSGWYNKTFRGIQSPNAGAGAADQNGETK